MPVLFAVAAVFYAAQLLKDIELPVILPVNSVQVQGELKFLDRDQISSLVRSNISGGYFTVDLRHVREILLQEPWVSEVALRRQWPAGINVYINEKTPVAYWNDEAYVSKKGDVFKPARVDNSLNLPELSGPEGQHRNVWKFMNVLYQEIAALKYEIKQLQLDNRRAWQLKIASINRVNTEIANSENNINVRLGRFDTDKRMQRFIRILPALATEMNDQGKKINVIDMRYPNGFAVQASEA